MTAGAVGRARAAAVVGLRPVEVTVEAHVGSGLPGMSVIGLSGSAGREAADRVRTALARVEGMPAGRKVLLSLAPAELPKSGASFDLAMAVGVLGAVGVVPARAARAGYLGELALDASVRPVAGVLPCAAALAALDGVDRLFVADANAGEAVLAAGGRVVPVADLAELVALLRGERAARKPVVPSPPAVAAAAPDLADVRGQPEARRALEVAAAGGHHLLLLGSPGCGKSMLAKRLPSVLPELSRSQAMELAAIRSVAGLLSGGDGATLDTVPPFRAPHRGASTAAILGGGSGVARPGELALAHRGVLFVDELFEWPRQVLESLREPLEEGVVRVARARATVAYPARFQLVCAGNPCPCGGGERCLCADEDIWRYRRRLSGPLADRLDLAPAVTRITADALLSQAAGEPSAAVAARVAEARAFAAERWGQETVNAEAPGMALRRSARRAALGSLAAAVESGELTARGYDRTLRVARTCADLEGTETIEQRHLFEAQAHRLALRGIGRPQTSVAS